MEETPEEHVERLVEGFREVRRVLKGDGTLWLNYGDTYNSDSRHSGEAESVDWSLRAHDNGSTASGTTDSLKKKDLVLMPHRVALALQDNGWWVRNDIIWHKTNPMPESVTDRCTTSYEHIFLLTKSKKYKWNQDAIREETSEKTNMRVSKEEAKRIRKARESGANTSVGRGGTPKSVEQNGRNKQNDSFENAICLPVEERNKRDVWTMSTKAFPEAHFATFPPELPETCIKAGTDEGDTVLDPFCGAGTTGLVADRLRRDFIGIELNEEYCQMARDRIYNDAPMMQLMDQ